MQHNIMVELGVFSGFFGVLFRLSGCCFDFFRLFFERELPHKSRVSSHAAYVFSRVVAELSQLRRALDWLVFP